MNHRAGLARNQTLLFPESLDDYITSENPVRFLDAFVQKLDLHALGFAKAKVAETGRPPYDPADLLKLYLYGYLHRIRSSRRLEQESHRNVELIWLLGQLHPDFKTIADFRKDNLKGLKAVCRQFTVLCQKLELFGGELIAIDGTKMRAVNARDQNFNQGKLEELIARADARLAEYLAQLDQSDATEPEPPPASRAELEQKIAALEEKRDWHKELLAEIQSGEDKQVSVTDPDSRRMRGSAGSVVGYNAQSVVDAKHKLIAAADVTNEATDVRQLGSMALQAKENLKIEKAEVLADTGYYNNAEVATCVERGLTPYVPKADTSANTAQGLFGKSQFRFDAAKDIYVCPGQQELTYRFSTYELGRSLRYYRASGCRQCALKAQCTRNKANRTITREDDEHLMEAMAERLLRTPEKIKQRKALVEHPFGTIKRALGYDHFLLKGLEKVRTEWSLITLAYNLKRVLNLVSLPKLLAAV
ncbi:MAG TPA: IS1182 family transposase, partial [Candidatus Binatia bacterium]|nr:IS1182 family transposase [Candidatus Binatia bacterium]